jgi:uncharacterized protein GlcG (DUF336 family)
LLSLKDAQKIIELALQHGHKLDLMPLTAAVLDAGGHTIALAREDGASNLRPEIAHAKAFGSLSLGIGSRAIFDRAEQQAFFIQSVNALANGALVPSPGGVLIRKNGLVVGAMGVTGDTGDNDEICAIFAINSTGFDADGG